MEYDLAKAGMHMLIEKPISMRPTEEVGRLGKVGPCLMRRGLILSSGNLWQGAGKCGLEVHALNHGRHHVRGLISLYSCT